MKERLGIGVVGAGAIGILGVLEHLSKDDVQDRIRLAAVCDPAPGRAEAAAKKYGAASHYATLDALLADRNVDAVTLCSPIGLHFEQGMAAIAAGKHVHFNKTMCTTVEEADKLIDAAAAKGVRLVASPGQMLRFAYNRRFRRVVLEGRLGTPIWASANCSMSHYHTQEKVRSADPNFGLIDPTWYYKKPGGGPVFDGTVYSLHNLTGILGPAKAVTGMSGLVIKQREFNGRPIACEMDDSTFFLIDFGNAFFAFSGGSVLGNQNKGFNPTIFGTGGTIEGSSFIPKKAGAGNFTFGDDEPAVAMDRPGDGFANVTGTVHDTMREKHVFADIMQLVDWVRTGTPSIVTAEHARHVVEIVDAAYRSARTGRTQLLRTTFEPLPLEACEAI